jgi:hypothetical protein
MYVILIIALASGSGYLTSKHGTFDPAEPICVYPTCTAIFHFDELCAKVVLDLQVLK